MFRHDSRNRQNMMKGSCKTACSAVSFSRFRFLDEVFFERLFCIIMQNAEVKRCSIFPVNDRYFLLIYILAETLPAVRHHIRIDCV